MSTLQVEIKNVPENNKNKIINFKKWHEVKEIVLR